MQPLRILITLGLLASSLTGLAEAVKDREGAVRKDRAAMENDARWMYNNIRGGLDAAKKSGKPLLVVLRCVPCLACAGIDASVLTDKSLDPLLDRFVCVRVINANALDLSLFQFDYDLSFSALFFNGDGTVYGRYGSWKHQKDPQDKTLAGFTRALEATLALHARYPANKAALAGKQGAATPYVSPLQIPALAGKYKPSLDWDGRVVPSCVHCHQIGEAYRESYRAAGKPIPNELIFPMPAPEAIGLGLAADQVAQVTSVAAGSVAEQAGLEPGDELLSLAGQSLVSVADVAWALHRAPDTGSIDAVIKRGGGGKTLRIELPSGWRAKSDISRRVGTWQMRGMAFGGLVLQDLTDAERTARKLATNRMALLVKHVGEYGKHAAAKNAGFRKDDVVVAVDGQAKRVTEGELIGSLLQGHRPGDKISAEVIRGTERLTLSLPAQ